MSQPAESKNNRSILLPPILLAILLGFILLYLAVPGNLIYPAKQVIVENKTKLSPEVQSEVKNSLLDRIDELENALQNGTCTEEGYVLDNPEMSLLPPSVNVSEDGSKSSLLIPPAGNINFQGDNLLNHLKSSSVFVAGENGFGSGFFVNENHIITNAHVVKSQSSKFKIVSPVKNIVFNATLLALTGDFESSNQDYAILKS